MEDAKIYIGTKIVKATPMMRHQFEKYLERESSSDEEDIAGYRVEYDDGYTSWSPKYIFERSYREVTPAEVGIITGSDLLDSCNYIESCAPNVYFNDDEIVEIQITGKGLRDLRAAIAKAKNSSP